MGEVQILGEFFFSKVMKKPILDADGKKVGSLMDIAVCWDQVSPRAVGIKYAKNVQNLIPVSWIESWNENGLQLKKSFSSKELKPLEKDQIYVGKWLLDKQIIDIKGSKLVRVNDIKLSLVHYEKTNSIILVAVDIGVRGLFRRIGMESLISRFENKFLGWQYINPLKNKMDNLQIGFDFEHERLSQLHPADIADIIEEMDHRDRTELINRLDSTWWLMHWLKQTWRPRLKSLSNWIIKKPLIFLMKCLPMKPLIFLVNSQMKSLKLCLILWNQKVLGKFVN